MRVMTMAFLVTLLLTSCDGSQPSGDPGSEAPVISSFTAQPRTIAPSESSTLSWSVSGATSLSLGPGIEQVTGSSHAVTPTQTTEYTLTASNAAGDSTATTTVTVTESGDDDGDDNGDGNDPDDGNNPGDGSDPGDGNNPDDGNEPAPAISNTIAYLLGDGSEIRLIHPDGTHDRLFWSTTKSDFEGTYSVTSLAWRPDSRELAFTSNHEAACSWYASDVYALRSDGSGLRRVTNAPTCKGLASLPQGRVTVSVQNDTFGSALFQVYIQGASKLEQISLGPGAGGTVTFDKVADFGDGIQPAVGILGGYRWLGGAVAEVKPDQTVHAGTLSISGSGFWGMGADKVTWHGDGSRLGYVFGECAAAYELSLQAGPGAVGTPLVSAGRDGSYPCVMDWGPTASTAHQFLYATMGIYDDGGIYLTSLGEGAGTRLVETLEFGYGEFIHDVAWLPDGSGFLFSGFLFPDQSGDYDYASNIYRYDFASQAVSQVSAFTEEFVRTLSISPDGQFVVFELESELASALPPDLWVMRLDGSGLRRLVQSARAPAWSR